MITQRTFWYLMPIEYVYAHTPIDSNVDNGLIMPCIKDAQEINIQSLIGSKLYNKLMLDASLSTLDGDYYTLVKDYIQPALVMWTLYYSYSVINFRLTNKAVVQKNSDDSTATSLQDMNYVKEEAKNKAEFYSKRMVDLIKANKESFPEYFEVECGCDNDELNPQKSVYFSGIYIPKKTHY